MVGDRPPDDDPADEATTELPRLGSRSRAEREARAARTAGGKPGTSPTDDATSAPTGKSAARTATERRRLTAERERVRREATQRPSGSTGATSRAGSVLRRTVDRLPGSPRLVAAVAGALVMALVVTFVVLGVRPDTTATPGSSGVGSTEVADPGGTEVAGAGGATTALLDADSMLTVQDAKLIDAQRSWRIASDQRGRDDSSPSAACVASSPPAGQPTPQQLQVRTLTATGAGPPAVLHQVQSYPSTEEAIQAFTLIVKAFGDCTLPKAWISSGATVSGVGDQVVALTFTIADATPQYRTVLVNRTGRVINILDAAQNGKAVGVTGVLRALGRVTDTQCTAAVGLCSGVLRASPGPPPLGGDEPGFLAVADLPPAGDQNGTWSALPTSTPAVTSKTDCEGVDLTATPARSRVARTYLWSATPTQSAFGLDDIVLTLDSTKAASDLAAKVVTNLRQCKRRQLTATTSEFDTVTGVGAQRAVVSATVARVQQKTTDATLQYRVAVVTAGTKVVYLFLPTETKLDVSTAEWTTIAVRAGQRATQTQ
ncbi:MAG: hypothetical protein ACR2LI_02005 [Propionibacteriaceae bacterium]